MLAYLFPALEDNIEMKIPDMMLACILTIEKKNNSTAASLQDIETDEVYGANVNYIKAYSCLT